MYTYVYMHMYIYIPYLSLSDKIIEFHDKSLKNWATQPNHQKNVQFVRAPPGPQVDKSKFQRTTNSFWWVKRENTMMKNR